MMTINKPEEWKQQKYKLIECKCYLCGTILKIHPLMNANAPWITDCKLHKENSTDE